MILERVKNFFKLQNASGIKTDHQDCILDSSQMTHEQCQLFLDTLKNKVVPHWHQRGTIQRLALRPLLELIDLYFKEKNTEDLPRKFSQELLEWAKILPDCTLYPVDSSDDVHCIYGQVIQVNKHPMYLIEIILDCLQTHSTDLDDKLKGIARWLCCHDASFIGEALALQELYAELKVGPAFNIECLRECLTVLPVTGSRIAEGIQTLLSNSVKIDSWTMNVLHEIYRIRWVEFLEHERLANEQADHLDFQQGGNAPYQLANELPYLGSQQGDNAPWIRLAQLVCGAGWFKHLTESGKIAEKDKKTGDETHINAHFKENYYRFLMPTIKCDTEPVHLNCIASHALSHLILSHNGRYLILLDTSLEQFNKTKKFYNWNTRQPRPLTETEIKRMQFSQFKAYIPKALETTRAEDMPISKNTIIGLKALVEGSFYLKGLVGQYAEAQMYMAGKALHLFYNFLKQLPSNERTRLLNQRIILGEKNKTVDEIFDQVDNDGEDRCIAGCAELLTQLVLDYDPYERLSPELEKRVLRYNMRENSRKKVYREYDGIDAVEAKRRILILAVSIMSHPFQYSLSGDYMSLWDCSNILVGAIKSIFKLIRPMIKHDDFKHARHVYATIIESLAKPAVLQRDQSWFPWFNDKAVRQRWLQSVADESLFKQPNSWFKPEFLLARLSVKAHQNLPVSPLLIKFLDEFVATYAQNQSTVLKEVRVNIKFAELLYFQEGPVRKQLLEYLKPYPSPSEQNKDELKGLFLNYLVARLSSLGVTSRSWDLGFFGQSTSHDKLRLKGLTEFLKSQIFALNTMDIDALKNRIKDMTLPAYDSSVKLSMQDYLQDMLSAIDPVYADGSKSPLPVLCSEFFSILPSI